MYAHLNTTHKLVVTQLFKKSGQPTGKYKHEVVKKDTNEVVGTRTGHMCFIAAEIWSGGGVGSYYGRLDLAVRSKAPVMAYIEDKPPFEIGN